jgi:ADP-heptose:LPS heptosyltransferase
MVEPRAFFVRNGYVLSVPPKTYQSGSQVIIYTKDQETAISQQKWKVQEVAYNPPRLRFSLHDLRPGEKLLLERRLGGLGDVLVQTQLFPMLKDQFPEIHVDYAVPSFYQSLFDGSGVIANRQWWLNESDLGANYAPNTNATHCRKSTVWKDYDLVEDISQCCAAYEYLQQWYGSYDGNYGLKWKDRLEIWAHFIGLKVQNPRTCIVLTPEEIQEAKGRFAKARKPVLLIAPFSGADSRSYAWHADVALQATQHWSVYYLHHQDLGPQTLMNLTIRQMGAAIAVADAVFSVDSSAFHWAGILRKPVVGIFNFLDGKSQRAKYYPTARCIQACATPCLANKYQKPSCPWKHQETLPQAPHSRKYSTCFGSDTVDQVLATLKDMRP